MSALGHMGLLTKRLGVVCYQSIMAWSDERYQHPDHCFSSEYIHLRDVQKHAKHLRRGFRDEELIKSFVDRVKMNTMGSYDGLATLVDQARFCEEEGIEGAFVELGTWKGGCLGIMAQANLKFSNTRRELHGFDSFQGIPMPRADKDDMTWATSEFRLSTSQCDGSLQPAHALEASKSEVEALLSTLGYPAVHVHLHAGWFQDTVPQDGAKIGPIAILRIDGDLYDSYMIALDHFWDNVVPGGFVIFDDWILKGCREAVGDFFARRGIRAYLCHVDHSVRYMQKAS
jgi:hypothetical protein